MQTELLRERYEPLEVVGRGGEGEVIRALDHLHGRHVALKVRRVSDEASRSHLLSEARLLLSLSPHPGLPLVREDFFVDERYVIAMDWIEGTDLQALLDAEHGRGLDPALVVGYLEQAAEALGHLHTHDPTVVHGDVKPANLILTSSGRIVLVDFGLSSRPTDELRRAGTAGYVAAELAAGARPTAASDVYSLAATAVALLTGEPPSGGAPSWGTIERARIPALERILRPNLAIDPVRRDASAAAFVARLQRWWGAALPKGMVTLVLADLSPAPTQNAEDSLNAVAVAHRGHCVSPVDDGPLMAAFASAQDGFDAARELAGRCDARVAVVTGEAEPRAGSYGWECASGGVRLLEQAERGQVLIDDPTAEAIDDRLPTEIGLAELRDVMSPAGPPIWALVASGLSIPPRAGTCPYRGLMAFRSEDGDLFFGRDEVVASIRNRLLDDGFMAVVGASGSGKSSLLRAGLVPAYGRESEGRIVLMTPGTDPVAELKRSLSDGPVSLLIVDQLEEMFTLCPDEAARARFIDALMDLQETGSVAIVVALRADYYGRCANHPRLANALAAHQHLLGPMRADELRKAVEGPARAAGLRFEGGLIDTMLADVEGEPGALPLLSHALYESWARRDGRVLTRAGYLAAGGVRGAIAHTADDVFLGCGEHEQVLMRGMFLQLTELGEATEDTRRRVPVAELLPEGRAGEEADSLIERLTAARLLVVGDESAEIAHEALIREWPRLRGWLGGRSRRAPSPPAADHGRALLGGERTRRRRSLPWSTPGGRGRAGGRQASARPCRTRVPGGEPGRPGPRTPGRSTSGQASARPARGRRGRAGSGIDRRIASPWCNVEAPGARRRSPRPAASPPSRGRSQRSTRTWGSFSRWKRVASTTRSTPAVRSSGRSSTARGSARGSRASTRPSTPRRSARTASSWPP